MLAVQSQIECKNGHLWTDINTRWVNKNGYTYRTCRICIRISQKCYWEKNPDKLKIKKLKSSRRNTRAAFIKAYEITPEEKHDIFILQGYKCATCESTTPQGPMGAGHGQWHLDHDHATGRIRGVLCARCNLILTKSMTSEILDRLSSYLKEAA